MHGQTPKLLVANRGEIAIRIFRSASELGWRTVALYTANDASHASYADEAVQLDSAARYMDAEHIARIALQVKCTHVHPGYGFLSESPKLASLFTQSSASGPRITFVGPSVHTLEVASDKMRSRELATSQGVPIAPGTRVSSAEDVHRFTRMLRGEPFPVMIKALDGGGGRGIRLVRSATEVEDAYQRCVGESASGRVFVEKAFVGPGWKHVEVQVVGDGRGEVTHLWERECSVQRRFQKVVEMAPSTLPREVIEHLVQAALKMSRQLHYGGLGTFEFLVNSRSYEWIFLEVNPRIQVEHTVTEEIMNLDLVRVQLMLSLPDASLATVLPAQTPSPSLPTGHAIQLRIVAEDTQNAFRLSTGTISPSEVSWPAGRGVRVDTWLSTGPQNANGDAGWTVGVDFDSLLAKVIVRAGTFQEATARALRALRETCLRGNVKTNVMLLAGIMAHPDWSTGSVHSRWLEDNIDEVLRLGQPYFRSQGRVPGFSPRRPPSESPDTVAGVLLLQPGTSFQLTLSSPTSLDQPAQTHNLILSSIGHNAFPNQLSGTINTSLSEAPLSFSLEKRSSMPTSSQVEFANPRDPAHVASPLAGIIVELHPALAAAADGDRLVRKGEPLVVVSVMKMESVVCAPASGEVKRVGRGVEVGAIVGEGALLCVLDPNGGASSRVRACL